MSSSTIWEELKAFVRGQTISQSSFQNLRRKTKLFESRDDISCLSALYAASPDPETFKKRIALQSRFNLLSTSQAKQLLLQLRQSFFECGDKAAQALASSTENSALLRILALNLSITMHLLVSLTVFVFISN